MNEDKYPPEVRARINEYLKNQEAEMDKKPAAIKTILMCIMLQKKQGLLKIVQDRGHITQVRTLLKNIKGGW